MIEFLLPVLALFAAVIAVGYYCHRWGFDDGRAEGYADGIDEAEKRATPQGGGGPGVRV